MKGKGGVGEERKRTYTNSLLCKAALVQPPVHPPLPSPHQKKKGREENGPSELSSSALVWIIISVA